MGLFELLSGLSPPEHCIAVNCAGESASAKEPGDNAVAAEFCPGFIPARKW
jgi:hypothetical protein